jgi:hypothetical protein
MIVSTLHPFCLSQERTLTVLACIRLTARTDGLAGQNRPLVLYPSRSLLIALCPGPRQRVRNPPLARTPSRTDGTCPVPPPCCRGAGGLGDGTDGRHQLAARCKADVCGGGDARRPLAPTARYIRGLASAKRCTDGGGEQTARTHFNQDDREELLAVGDTEAG